MGVGIDYVKKFMCEKENFPIGTESTFSESGYTPPIMYGNTRDQSVKNTDRL